MLSDLISRVNSSSGYTPHVYIFTIYIASTLLIVYLIIEWMCGAHAYVYQFGVGLGFAGIFYYVKFTIYHRRGIDYLCTPSFFKGIVLKYRVI